MIHVRACTPARSHDHQLHTGLRLQSPHTHTHACTHIHTCMHTHTHMHAHTNIYSICTHILTYTHTTSYTHRHICARTHTHRHTHTHTHTAMSVTYIPTHCLIVRQWLFCLTIRDRVGIYVSEI